MAKAIQRKKKMETFVLFSKEGKGKRSKNDPCTVNFEPINIDALSADQKAALLTSLVKDKARAKYAKLSKGYRMLNKFMADAKEMITPMLAPLGMEPSEEQIKNAAMLLAKREDVELAFAPVVEFNLSQDEILAESDDDEAAGDTATE